MEPALPRERFANRHMRTQLQRTQSSAVEVPLQNLATASLIDLFQRIHEATLLHDLLVEEALVALAGMSDEFHNVPLTIVVKTSQESQSPGTRQPPSDSGSGTPQSQNRAGRLAVVMVTFFFSLAMLYLIFITKCDDYRHEFICNVHDLSFKITFYSS
ncbi:hypothetical protein F5141DRAFT_1219992 [Pisolithus sp. B1]|nr:hypothetical protein F5141DRAFT_1219992 [Pisolithus sp. B1]